MIILQLLYSKLSLLLRTPVEIFRGKDAQYLQLICSGTGRWGAMHIQRENVKTNGTNVNNG